MADEGRQKPYAEVTLIMGKTFRTRRLTFVHGRPVKVVGESNIRYFETDNRFVVRRGDAINKETVAARKKVKANARKVKPKGSKATPKKGAKSKTKSDDE